jgi:TnpA family transposase
MSLEDQGGVIMKEGRKSPLRLQGITLRARVLFHSTVISAAERESAYVIDGLMHNDVVKSDVHSTDTHGYKVAGKTLHLGYFSRKSEEDLCSSCGQGARAA